MRSEGEEIFSGVRKNTGGPPGKYYQDDEPYSGPLAPFDPLNLFSFKPRQSYDGSAYQSVQENHL